MNDNLLTIADGTQSVVLRRSGSDFAAEIASALMRPFRSHRYSTIEENVIPAKSAHWYLAVNSFDGEPLEGDEIEDAAGNRWTIYEVNRSELNGTWQCVTKSFTVPFGLDEYADLMRTAYTKTSAGSLQRGFRTVKTGIAAKFTPAVQTFDSVRKETLYAMTREPIEAELHDVLRRADGSLYEIIKIQPPLYKNGWTEIELVVDNG